MEPRPSRFNRYLLIVLAVLFVVTLGWFSSHEWLANPDPARLWMMLINVVIIAIPLVLLYGGIYLLVVAWREHNTLGQVNPRLAAMIHWAPRAAAVVTILFLGLFSLDVLGMGGNPLQVLGGFLMHNIPAIVLVVLLVFAWRRPVVGFVAFLAAAVLFLFFFVRNIYALPNLFMFVLPILLVAGLFYADWKWLEPQPPEKTGMAR